MVGRSADIATGGKSAISEKVIAFFGYIVIFYVEPFLFIFALL